MKNNLKLKGTVLFITNLVYITLILTLIYQYPENAFIFWLGILFIPLSWLLLLIE